MIAMKAVKKYKRVCDRTRGFWGKHAATNPNWSGICAKCEQPIGDHHE